MFCILRKGVLSPSASDSLSVRQLRDPKSRGASYPRGATWPFSLDRLQRRLPVPLDPLVFGCSREERYSWVVSQSSSSASRQGLEGRLPLLSFRKVRRCCRQGSWHWASCRATWQRRSRGWSSSRGQGLWTAGGSDMAWLALGDVIWKVGTCGGNEQWKSTGERRAGVVRADTYLIRENTEGQKRIRRGIYKKQSRQFFLKKSFKQTNSLHAQHCGQGSKRLIRPGSLLSRKA